MTPVRLPPTTEICFSIALVSSGLLYADREIEALNVDYEPAVLRSAPIETDVVVDSRSKKWSKFRDLAEEWQRERSAMSSITEMSMLPSYQRIIGLGEDAIPLILAQLRAEGDEPDQWFWALRSLTDANPVRAEDQGDFQAMAQAWLEWGEREGYAG